MDLDLYRQQPEEREREASLLGLLPAAFESALDVGARDGHFSRLLADRAQRVVALDLTRPAIDHPRVENVAGDVTRLEFADSSFDVVFCAEVLEHIPNIKQACRELARVTRRWLLIGVPYRQDTRAGRNTCKQCSRINPPYGHVNTFDEHILRSLFPSLTMDTTSFAGENREYANALSTQLMDWAGNPWGTYEQDEPCLYCGRKFEAPSHTGLTQRALAFLAARMNRFESALRGPHPNWIHVLFRR